MFTSFLVIVSLTSYAVAATTHTVTVGQVGSFYDPPTIAAGINDTVMFVFSGEVHGVVQTSFNTPCVPLLGGFSSGLQGTGSNFSKPIAFWNLTVTNVSETIWYYCPASRPFSHCAAGMVGAINVPNQDMYDKFMAASKATEGNETIPVSVVNSGIGAFATASPSPTAFPNATTTANLSSTPATSIASSTTSATDFTDSSSGHTGAIAGGATAAAVIVVLGVFLVFYLIRRKNKRRQAAVSQPFSYTPASPPHSGMSDTFPIMRSLEPSTPPSASFNQTFYGPQHQNSNPSTAQYKFPPEIYSDASRPHQAQLRPEHSLPHTQNPQGASTKVGQDSLEPMTGNNLNALANEVAAVLMQSPTFSSKVQELRPGTGDSRSVLQNTGSDSSSGIFPPHYRAR